MISQLLNMCIFSSTLHQSLRVLRKVIIEEIDKKKKTVHFLN